jgi:hypothetical protein
MQTQDHPVRVPIRVSVWSLYMEIGVKLVTALTRDCGVKTLSSLEQKLY